MTIGSYLDTTTAVLRQAGIETARLDTLVLLSDELVQDKAWLLAHTDALLTPEQQMSLQAKIIRRQAREPLSYVRGVQEFFGHAFTVNPDVLVPRPETELLVERAIKLDDVRTVLDVGTGSGAIAISIKLARPELQVFATDISPKSLAVARQNAQKLGADITFAESDLLDTSPIAHPDCIVANLPYVDDSWERSPETEFEPSMALFAEDFGLHLIKKLITQAAVHLRPDDYLLLEADPRQHDPVVTYGTAAGFKTLGQEGYAVAFTR